MSEKTIKTEKVKIESNFSELSENATYSLFNKIGEFLALTILNDNPIDIQNFKVTLKSNNNYGIQQNTDNTNLSNDSNECNKLKNKLPITYPSK
jgi:hypothetical protein